MVTIQTLEKRLLAVETKQNLLDKALKAYGINSEWLSPSKAASLLSVGKDRLYEEIKLAEKFRLIRKKGDCVYGTHYRNDQSLESEEPYWKINVLTFDEVLSIPPDERRVIN